MALPKLIYFGSRGRAEFIRLTLAEAGVEYEEENFKGAEGFAALKASGRLPFGAVPVWEEDGWRLAQSGAILNHIARAHGLGGTSPREQALVDQALGAAEDVRQEFRKIQVADAAKRAEVRAEQIGTVLPRWFGQLERLLASSHAGKDYFVGDAVTVADLAIYYVMEIAADNGLEATFADCPLLRAFKDRIAARPKIAAWRASPRRHALVPLPK